MKKRRRWFVGIKIYSILALIPILFTVFGCFMGEIELAQYYNVNAEGYLKPHFIPEYFTLEQFRSVLFDTPDYLYQFWNSVALLVPGVLLALLVSVTGGYALAKCRIPARRSLELTYLLVLLLPVQITLVPQFILFYQIHLTGTRLAMLLLISFSPMGTLLMQHFIAKVPQETLESARIDGAREWTILFRVVLPQIWYGVAGLAILLMVDVWEMVEQPLVLLTKNSYPFSVTLSHLSASQPSVIFVCGLIYMIPMLLLFGILGEQFGESMDAIF